MNESVTLRKQWIFVIVHNAKTQSCSANQNFGKLNLLL